MLLGLGPRDPASVVQRVRGHHVNRSISRPGKCDERFHLLRPPGSPFPHLLHRLGAEVSRFVLAVAALQPPRRAAC